MSIDSIQRFSWMISVAKYSNAVQLLSDVKLHSSLSTSNTQLLSCHRTWPLALQSSMYSLVCHRGCLAADIDSRKLWEQLSSEEPATFSGFCRRQADRHTSFCCRTDFTTWIWEEFNDFSVKQHEICIQNFYRLAAKHFPICPLHTCNNMKSRVSLFIRGNTDEEAKL